MHECSQGQDLSSSVDIPARKIDLYDFFLAWYLCVQSVVIDYDDIPVVVMNHYNRVLTSLRLSALDCHAVIIVQSCQDGCAQIPNPHEGSAHYCQATHLLD